MSDIVTLNGYKIKDEKAIRSYDSIASMKADTKLKEGYHVKTKGYYEANDGGHGEYVIVDDDTLVDDGGSIHALTNGLRAKLLNNMVNPEMFGAYGDNTHDDTNALNKMFNSNVGIIRCKANKIYLCSDTVTITKRININFGLSTIKFTNDGVGLVIDMETENTMPHKRFAPILENLILDGENTTKLMYIDYAYKSNIRNIYLNNFKNIGMEKNRGYELVIDNIWLWASNRQTSSIGLLVTGNDCEYGNIFGINCHTGVKMIGGGNHFKQIHMWLFNDTQGDGILDGNVLYEGSAMIEIAGNDRYFIDYAYFDSYQYGIKYNGYGQVYLNSGLMYCPDISTLASNYLNLPIYLIYAESPYIDFLWRISVSNLSYILASGNTVTAKVIPDNYAKRPLRFNHCIIPYNINNLPTDYIDRFTFTNCTNVDVSATPIGNDKLRIHGRLIKDNTSNQFIIPYPSSEYQPIKVNEIVPCVTSSSQWGTSPSLNMINIGSTNINGLGTAVPDGYYFIDVTIKVVYQ